MPRLVSILLRSASGDGCNDLTSLSANRLTRHQERNSPFRLMCIETTATHKGLAALALIRVQEIEGFVHGLFGRQEEIDLPERAHRALDDLGKMRAMFAAVQDLEKDETKAAPLKEMETTLRHMREMKKNAEHAMHTVVLSCKRARKQMLAGVPASKPTMH